MAVQSIPLSSRLQLRLHTGYDEDNDPIIRTRTFSNLKTDADAEDVHEVATQLAGLQEHDVEKIRKVEEVELIEG